MLTRPRQFGPDNAHTVRPRRFDEVALGHPAGRSLGRIAAFAKAAADDHEPVDALVPALLDYVEHDRCGYRDDRKLDRIGNLENARVRPNAVDVMRIRVDRIERAVQSGSQQIPEDGVADLALMAARADDRDRGRVQQPRDGPRVSALLPLAHDRLGQRGRTDVKLQVHFARVEASADLVAGVAKHPQHRLVLDEHDRNEPRQTALLGGGGQVFQQHRADPSALMFVGHYECDLSLVGTGLSFVPADRNDVLAQQSDERDPVVVIDVGVPVQLLLGNSRVRREVPQIPGSARQPVMERDDRVGILRSDRAQVHRAAVGRDDIGLPVRRVRRRLTWLVTLRHGSVAGVVRIQAEQRERGLPGSRDRPIQPRIATGHPGINRWHASFGQLTHSLGRAFGAAMPHHRHP